MQCTKCGRSLSSVDQSCPVCGTPAPGSGPEPFPWTRLMLIAAVGLVLIGVAFQVSRGVQEIGEVDEGTTRADVIERAMQDDEVTANLDD